MNYNERTQTLREKDGRKIFLGTMGNEIPEYATMDRATIIDVYCCKSVRDGFYKNKSKFDKEKISLGEQGLAIRLKFPNREKDTLYIGGEGKWHAVISAMTEMGALTSDLTRPIGNRVIAYRIQGITVGIDFNQEPNRS